MAISRPKPKKLSPEAQAIVTQASAQQTGQTQKVKSYDPNFPVFDVPVNQKLLVYIPNHTITDAEGNVTLNWDKFAAHPVIDGRTYADVRCSSGIVLDALGYDGSCPLCNGIAENWDLYQKEYADVAKSKGIDISSPEAGDALKADRQELVKKMTIKQAEVWYTFPIIVIDCEEKDGVLTTTPKKNEKGEITGKPYFYSIRERTYNDKWIAGFDSVDTDTQCPAGMWAILNFTCTSKNPTKMESAKNLKVTFRSMDASYNAWAEYFDEMTNEWTPEKAQEVVVLDAVRDMDELKEVADTLLKPVRDKIAMYDLVGGGVPQNAGALPSGNAEATLAGFGATAIEGNTENPTGEMPNVGASTGV